MYSTSETVGLELKYIAKDLTKAGLSSAKAALSSFSGFALGVASKVKAAFSKVWSTITSPVALITGGMGIGAAFFGIKSYLQGAVRTAGEWEGYLAKLTVALKSASKAKEAFEWSKQFAATTPFEMGEVVDATTRLEMYGLTAKKWLPLVGDMAGAMGRQITDAVEAIADAISGGGLERLKEFGISSTQLIKYGAKSTGGGYSLSYQGPEAIEALKKALMSLMSERYGGGMTKLLATWQGKTSNLADAWTQIKGRIGEGMMPVLKRIVDKTTEWLNKLRDAGVGEKIGKKLGGWIEWAWGKFQQGLTWAIENWPNLTKKASSWATILWLWVKFIGQKIADWTGYGGEFNSTLGKANANLADIAQGARDLSAVLFDIGTMSLKIKMTFGGWKLEVLEIWSVIAKLGELFNKWLEWQEKIPFLTFGWWTNKLPSGTNKERREFWEDEVAKADEAKRKDYSEYWTMEDVLSRKKREAEDRLRPSVTQPNAGFTAVPGGTSALAGETASSGGYYQVPIVASRGTVRIGRAETERRERPGTMIYYGPGATLPKGAVQVTVENTQAIGAAMQRGQQRTNAAPAY